jgi:glycosyltransferase involved in cell wall biosynthesis
VCYVHSEQFTNELIQALANKKMTEFRNKYRSMDILLVDDGSRDETVSMALGLGLSTFVHDANYGYGRNQKTCYNEALKLGADVIVMLHPDYQYTPRLIMSMAAMIAYDVFDVVLGSRILGVGALKGGCPITNTCRTGV